MDPTVPQPDPTIVPANPLRRLTHKPAHALRRLPPERRWLIEGLWREAGVGVIGGEPKVCKTILAIDMAIAVASGQPCLRHYPVPRPGPALLFLAEDQEGDVLDRIEQAARVVGVAFDDLPIELITEHRLHLDMEADRVALEVLVAELRPRMLVLDPFVRLHQGMNENSSGAVAPVLGALREIQRRYEVAVILIHHSRKASGRGRAGQELRGSSDFHAWGDSNLYLRRDPGSETRIWLATEHRAAPSISGIELEEVKTLNQPSTLRWVDPAASTANAQRAASSGGTPDGAATLLRLLAEGEALSTTELRKESHLRNTTVREILDRLRRQNRVRFSRGLWRRVPAGTAGTRPDQ